LFGLPRRFTLDTGELESRRRTLQGQAHPDRFAASGAAAQKMAMLWSARINEAYGRLKQPLKRAAYLCELAGAPIDAENNTTMPAAFLATQMAWRETLDAATTPGTIDVLEREVGERRRAGQAALAAALDGPDANPAAAAGEVRALMFVERFARELAERRSARGS